MGEEGQKEIQKRMGLSKLKAFINSLPNIEFLEAAASTIDFSAVARVHLKILNDDNEPTSSISVNADRREINSWLLASFNSFALGDIFYIHTEDFPGAPWIKVKVDRPCENWLLPLVDGLNNCWIQFVPTTFTSIFEFREREHHFATFIARIE
jgi:plasmid maintenance system killer protein